MRKVLPALILVFLFPGMMSAAVMGIHFGQKPVERTHHPVAFVVFDAYVYLLDAGYYVTGVEYQLVAPLDPGHVNFQIGEVRYPDNMSVVLGNPYDGHSIAFWPPVNGYIPGYNLVCSYTCFTTEACHSEGGVLSNYELVIGPHPESGELRGTHAPDNEFFPIGGLASTLCPEPDTNGGDGWGAVFSMYR